MSLACDLKTLTCPPMPLNHIWEPLDATVRKKKKMLQILKRFAGKFNYLTDEYRPSSFLYSKNANTCISGAVANMKQITFQVIQIYSCSRWKQDYVSNKNTNQLQLLIYRAYYCISGKETTQKFIQRVPHHCNDDSRYCNGCNSLCFFLLCETYSAHAYSEQSGFLFLHWLCSGKDSAWIKLDDISCGAITQQDTNRGWRRGKSNRGVSPFPVLLIVMHVNSALGLLNLHE